MSTVKIFQLIIGIIAAILAISTTYGQSASEGSRQKKEYYANKMDNRTEEENVYVDREQVKKDRKDKAKADRRVEPKEALKNYKRSKSELKVREAMKTRLDAQPDTRTQVEQKPVMLHEGKRVRQQDMRIIPECIDYDRTLQ